MKIAKRIQSLPPYFFARLGKRIAQLNSQGRDVIRLDIGSPDMPPADFIVDTLCHSAQDSTHHGYAGYYGIPELRQAMVDAYAHRFGVELDVKTEVLPCIGSKEGLVNVNLAFVDPGDAVLVPDPGYPSYSMGTLLAGGKIVRFPLFAERGWLPDLDAISPDVARKAKIMWLNYPNNPTAAVADLDFFARAVEFARRYDILLCHDAPYCDVTFDGYVAPSILQVPGAKEVAIEFNSLSKTYNMAGWRVGLAVGNAQAIGALATVKTNIDSGIFRAIQDAAVAALGGDQEWVAERNRVYEERRDILLEGLRAIGIEALRPKASLYVWAPVPAGWTSEEWASQVLEQVGVSMTPGTAFVPNGEGYVRISMVRPTARIQEAMARLRHFKA